MEKPRSMAARRLLGKIAVSQEPGLTNAQLMLTNHDLKPGKELFIIICSKSEGFEADLRKLNRRVANGAHGTSLAFGLPTPLTSCVRVLWFFTIPIVTPAEYLDDIILDD